MIISYQKPDGTIFNIGVPFSTMDIRFDDFCDFKAGEHIYIEKSREEKPDIASAMMALVNTIQTMVTGNIADLPFSLPADSPQDLIDGGYLIRNGHDLSVIRIYAHILTIIRTYRPKNIPPRYRVKLNEGTFVMSGNDAARIMTGQGYTTGETVEIMEFRRNFQKRLEINPMELGNLEFNLGLTEMAILLRKPKEELPADESELEAFINERKKVMANMHLGQVLDVRFFLINALLKFARRKSTPSSGKVVRLRKGGRNRTGK